MKCKKCGAVLEAGDQFCTECGARVIVEKRCPECGTMMRTGIKFCPGCGYKVTRDEPEAEEPAKVSKGKKSLGVTQGIELDLIEASIINETVQELKEDTVVRKSPARKSTPAPEYDEYDDYEERPRPKRKQNLRDIEYDEEDYDDDDDYDDEDDSSSISFVSILMAVIGIIIIAVIALLFINKSSGGLPFLSSEKKTETQSEDSSNTASEENADIESDEFDSDDTEFFDDEPIISTGKSVIINKNVNVRNKPSTQDSEIIKVAQAGETYPYIGDTEETDWIEIQLPDGTTAYVNKDYVTIE